VVKENQQKILKNSSLLNNLDKSNKHLYIDFTIDKINLKIIKALMENPNIKSSELSEKLQVPLSTIQRRRAVLEKTDVVKKEYILDLRKFGLRIAEILIDIEKGNHDKLLEDIKVKFNKNIISVSRKIGDPGINIGIKIVYSDSIQLFEVLEELRKNSMVKKFDWFESITEEKAKEISFIDLVNKE
jgi:DNA-binding Lrp family transcriptional regulator